jgi:hypothetical protein
MHERATEWLLILVFMSLGSDCVSDLWPPKRLLFTSKRYMSIESHGGMILTGEYRRTRRKNLSQYHFFCHKSHMDWLRHVLIIIRYELQKQR